MTVPARHLGVAALLATLLLLAPTSARSLPAAAPGLHPPAQLAATSVPDGWPRPPAVGAGAYLLLDADTGQVLAERNADRPRPVASTVKVLTALTVLHRTSPDDEVVVPEAATAVGGASAGLRPGAVWTVAELLDGMIARSGNDAATALAIHVGGSVEGFVELMRADAAALGLEDVTLSSPTGLSDANRLSARHLAVVARAALDDPRFRRVAARRSVVLPSGRRLPNRNELLDRYPGATGIKTGFTSAAGYALVASAERGGRELVAVVLDADDADQRFSDAAALLDHGFGGFSVVPATYDARLRRGGGWVDLHAPARPVTVPRDAPGVTVVAPLPIEVPAAGTGRTVVVRWQGEELARLPVEVRPGRRPDLRGGARLGRWLADRAYAAMRAATTTGAWATAGGPSGAPPSTSAWVR